MIPGSENTQKPKLYTWSIVTTALYATVGYFLGNEFSVIVGFLLTIVGITIGFIFSKKLESSSVIFKVVILFIPVIFSGLVMRLQKNSVAALTNNLLIGTWSARDNKGVFTMHIKNTNALLSVEPGLKNVEYQYRINSRNDSLVLINDADDRLLWHIISAGDNHIILDADNGLLFKKISNE